MLHSKIAPLALLALGLPGLTCAAVWTNQPTVRYQAVSTGALSKACALRDDGTVLCWSKEAGAYNPSVVGIHTVAGRYKALSFSQLIGRGEMLCAIRTSDSTIACFGQAYSPSGAPLSSDFAIPAGAFKSIEVSATHGCAIRVDDTVACWGTIPFLGKPVPPAGKFRSLSVSEFKVCGLRQDKWVACWPQGYSRPVAGPYEMIASTADAFCGLLASGALDCFTEQAGVSQTKGLPSLKYITTSRKADGQFCGVDVNGGLICWSAHYLLLKEQGSFKSVAVEGRMYCALDTKDDVRCWDATALSAPLELKVPPAFTSISSGTSHACGVRGDGTLQCWGQNKHGETVPPEGQFLNVSAGNQITCGVRTDNTVTCWGRRDTGLIPAPPAARFRTVSVHLDMACATVFEGVMQCWGSNPHVRSAPTYHLWTAVSVGWNHGCMLDANGYSQCWGDNTYKQTKIPATAFKAIAAGSNHSCAIRLWDNDKVMCWGANGYGQSNDPASNYISVAAGSMNSCGIRSNGTIGCWGANFSGQTSPLPPGSSFKQVSLGSTYGCALDAKGKVACWGDL